jgi:cytochrome c biogenesis protein CcdA
VILVDAPLALAAGLLAVASPCVLPILPFLLGATATQHDRTRPLLIMLGFVAAFTMLAWLFGRFANALGLAHGTVRSAALLLLAIAGMLMIWPRPFDMLVPRLRALFAGAGAKPARIASDAGGFGALLLGASMGAVWAPCAGPAFAAILALVAGTSDPARPLVLLLCFAVGAALPMLAIAYGGQAVAARVRASAPYAGAVRKAGGLVIVLAAAAMHWQYDTALAVWLTTAFDS